MSRVQRHIVRARPSHTGHGSSHLAWKACSLARRLGSWIVCWGRSQQARLWSPARSVDVVRSGQSSLLNLRPLFLVVCFVLFVIGQFHGKGSLFIYVYIDCRGGERRGER